MTRPKRPSVVLVPTRHVALVLDRDGWHMAAVPPEWWLAEREAELEDDCVSTAVDVAKWRHGQRWQPRRLTRARRRLRAA